MALHIGYEPVMSLRLEVIIFKNLLFQNGDLVLCSEDSIDFGIRRTLILPLSTCVIALPYLPFPKSCVKCGITTPQKAQNLPRSHLLFMLFLQALPFPSLGIFSILFYFLSCLHGVKTICLDLGAKADLVVKFQIYFIKAIYKYENTSVHKHSLKSIFHCLILFLNFLSTTFIQKYTQS